MEIERALELKSEATGLKVSSGEWWGMLHSLLLECDLNIDESEFGGNMRLQWLRLKRDIYKMIGDAIGEFDSGILSSGLERPVFVVVLPSGEHLQKQQVLPQRGGFREIES